MYWIEICFGLEMIRIMAYFGLEMNRNIADFGLEMHENLFVFALDLQNNSIFAYVMACVVCLRNELSYRCVVCEISCRNFTD